MVIYIRKYHCRDFVNLIRKKCFFLIFLLIFFFDPGLLRGQDPYNYFYRIYFRDKGNSSITDFAPGDLLSDKAIKRREKSGIPVLQISDIPVSSEYIENVKSLGLNFHCASKWMNTALFKSPAIYNTNDLLSLPFVADVKLVKNPAPKSLFKDKLHVTVISTDPLPFERPVTQLNGHTLHNSGFTGIGILIAVLDGGFLYADKASSLTGLNNRKGIKATYDFVNNKTMVYDNHTHGTSVLSVLAGKEEGVIAGTAPGADFLLFRTEDANSEFPVEEDFWAAAAEFADSAGADIISSSLGYSHFDNPAMNYKYEDLDGSTVFITRVAEAAASKGIMVFNSAGNERNNPWIHIIAPADGENVVAVGSVDLNNVISSFSSAGPSADGRIKPDNTAMGGSIPVQVNLSTVAASSGTSFSCPVLSGMTACLLQAIPMATNTEIMGVLHSSGHKSIDPDSLYGYGTPDMKKAIASLHEIHIIIPENEAVLNPNPTTGSLEIIFRDPPETLIIELFSILGKSLFRKSYPGQTGRTIRFDELQGKKQGLYIIRLTTGNGTFARKVIKLNN